MESRDTKGFCSINMVSFHAFLSFKKSHGLTVQCVFRKEVKSLIIQIKYSLPKCDGSVRIKKF